MDIIDRIDELVDAQLAGGEPRQGYDYGDRTYPKCPHCDRHWHGLRITERIAEMYSYGTYDEDYSAAEDDTPVLCQGSDFIGPMPASKLQHGWSFRGTPRMTMQLHAGDPVWPTDPLTDNSGWHMLGALRDDSPMLTDMQPIYVEIPAQPFEWRPHVVVNGVTWRVSAGPEVRGLITGAAINAEETA